LTGAAVLCVVPVRNAAAQTSIYAYPNAGQSQEQQRRDRAECYAWAVQQTGVDPLLSPPQAAAPLSELPAPAPSGGLFGLGEGGLFPGGGALGDAATGAGLGAAGGALAGDPGKGAALGALAGAVLGGIHRQGRRQEGEARRESQRRRAQQQSQQWAQVQGSDSYARAFAACMSARNYTVR
jgi:hypothetical protein